MYRETIDFGIDLGTTNSSIAMWRTDGQVEVLKNPLGSQSTPSAVYEGRQGRQLVGPEAKEQMKVDPENVHTEFKQQMGRSTTFSFPVSGRAMKPEELSAEVLKSLKGDVQRRLNENLNAAVITIPAAFDKSEIYATNKAAELAGFLASPLCLEPVAAALAYGHQNASEDGFWLVFDFGGGTFDAAVVQLKDEEFQVVNHHGDNYLGGKLIDWAIVDQLVIPAVQKEFNLPDFGRQNDDPKIRTAISALKLATEKAKMQLSTSDTAWVEIDDLRLSSTAERMPFDFELNRSDVNRMAEPYILRAVQLCRAALKEKRLGPQDMQRLILVGGPTQMPIFREMLADKNIGLGIPLEYSVDPMTVVAQGAAIFARTQKFRPPKRSTDSDPGARKIVIELEYEPAGADDQPPVAGRLILPDGQAPEGYTIEFSKSDWRSGRIRVSSEGAFLTQLIAERGENVYAIEVQDTTGTVQKASPDRISYLRKAMFKEIPLSHSIAVEKSDNTIDLLFEKGLPLPLKKARTYQQSVHVSKDNPDTAIRIPLVEGSNIRADRNMRIGCLEITSDKIKRDVPVGSDVEFTLSIDASNRMTATAYIPVLDQEFEETIDHTKREVEIDRVKQYAEAEIARFNATVEKVSKVGDEAAAEALENIRDQHLVEQVEEAMNLPDSPENKSALTHHIRNLRVAIDEVEYALEWPVLVIDAQYNREWAEKVIDSKYANPDEKTLFSRLCQQHDQALEKRDSDLLRRVNSEFDDLYWDIFRRNPGFWVNQFEKLKDSRTRMTDPGLADELINQGRRSIDNDDLDGLKSAVRQLYKLLPRDEAQTIQNAARKGSTVH
jgi:molecular chaperone DnaK